VSAYQVVPYQPELLPEIVRLWEESRSASELARRREVFRWYTERNPFLRGRPPYWCLHDGARIIGMHGHMPVVYDVDGRERLGHMAQDDLLHPSCRGKGLGQVLLDGVRAQAPDFAAAMWFNDANHRSYGKAGWIDVPGFRRWVRFLDAGRLVKEIGNPALARAARIAGPLALRALDLPGWLRRRGGLRFEPIEQFDARFDALWERAKAGLGISVRRSSAYLDWRYAQMPLRRYERFAALDARDQLLGYLVWRFVPEDGRPLVRIFDVLVDPAAPGVLEAMIAHVIAAARRENATHVVCAAAHPPLVAGLRRLGFLANRREEYHMISNWEPGFVRPDVTDIRRWHLTLGDADGDVWSDD